MSTPEMSDVTTAGVRVGASARYLPDESDMDLGRYIFGYRIVIANNGDKAVTLMSRRWRIIDAEGNVKEVKGDGVVGEQPRLTPGQAFKYMSFCPLGTQWGTMEGVYHMRYDDGEMFEVKIGRFYLIKDRLGETFGST